MKPQIQHITKIYVYPFSFWLLHLIAQEVDVTIEDGYAWFDQPKSQTIDPKINDHSPVLPWWIESDFDLSLIFTGPWCEKTRSCLLEFVNSKGADQHAHLRRLTSTFVIPF